MSQSWKEANMLRKLTLPTVAFGTALAIMTPGAALARDHDRDHERREWREHERHERREREWREHYRHAYRYGYYDRWGYWHPYGYYR
jgi:hypothetical protein